MSYMTCCSSVHSSKKRLNRSGERVIHKACLTEGARIKSLLSVGWWIEGGEGEKGACITLLQPNLQK